MNQIKHITINASKCIPAMWGRPSMVNRCITNYRSSVIASSKLHQLANYQCQMRQLHTQDKNHWKVNVPKNRNIVLEIHELGETTSSKTHELHVSLNGDGKLYVHAKKDSNVVYTDGQINISASTLSLLLEILPFAIILIFLYCI